MGDVAKKAGLEKYLNKVTIRVQETTFLFDLTTKEKLVMRMVLIVSKKNPHVKSVRKWKPPTANFTTTPTTERTIS